MKRVFAAIVPNEAAIAELASHISDLRAEFPNAGANWVSPGNLHITLHFAGELDEPQVESFQDRVAAAGRSTPAFKARLARAGVFVDSRMGRSVLWVGVSETEGAGGHIAVAAAAIKAARQETQNRFVPHVTIARVRDSAPSNLLAAHQALCLKPVVFDVDAFTVLESTLTHTGPVYSVLSRHILR